MNKQSEIYQAHEAIGFPSLDKQTQFDAIVHNRYQPIADLCPEYGYEEYGFYYPLLEKYITVTKTQLRAYLVSIDYVSEQLKTYSPLADGHWLRKTDEGYELIYRERGLEYPDKVVFNSEVEVLSWYVEKLGRYCK